MKRRALLHSLPVVLLPLGRSATAQLGGVAVIGHPDLARVDVPTIQRIYTGRVVEVAGLSVTPINVSSNNPVRARFLATYLSQNEENYLAYWTVRRYIGKGVPPREVETLAEVIRLVQSTRGAIGYIDEASLAPGLNVIVR